MPYFPPLHPVPGLHFPVFPRRAWLRHNQKISLRQHLEKPITPNAHSSLLQLRAHQMQQLTSTQAWLHSTLTFNKFHNHIFINLTSLIDVVLNLIIFFVLSTTFIKPSGFKVELPRSAVEETVKAGEEIVVVVTREDEILMDGQPYSSGALLDKLTEIKEANSGKTITI